jgi:hypothetical protein
MCATEAIIDTWNGGAPHEYHDSELNWSVQFVINSTATYIVYLIIENMNTFAMVVEHMKSGLGSTPEQYETHI